MLKDLFSLTKKEYVEDEVELHFLKHQKPSIFNDYWDSYYYDIQIKSKPIKVGSCDVRLGMNEELYYAGNIGYRIFENYRGHSYAYQATKQLLLEAKKLGMEEVIITCSPDNIASKKTIEKLNAVLIEEVDVPSNHYLYQRGERRKRIYRIIL